MKGSWTSPVLSLNSMAVLTCLAIAKLLLPLYMHPHTIIIYYLCNACIELQLVRMVSDAIASTRCEGHCAP